MTVAKQTRPVSHMNVTKQRIHRVKLKEDKKTCSITDLAITEDGRLLMVDRSNDEVKMFSHDMKFLSSVLVPLYRTWYLLWTSDLIPQHPRNVAVISEKEAAVTTTNNTEMTSLMLNSLVTLDISGNQLHTKASTYVPYSIRGITKYNNKLVISSVSPIPSVKLIDLTGKVYWSVSSDQQGQSLFSRPWYLTSHGEGRSSTVIVSDWGNNTMVLLNGETGDVITRRQLQEKMPYGVTTDTDGNVFVCCHWTHEVSVLSRDLSEEKTLLYPQDGLSGGPQAIVYADKTRQLLISYIDKDSINMFELS